MVFTAGREAPENLDVELKPLVIEDSLNEDSKGVNG